MTPTQEDGEAARKARASMLIGGFEGKPDVWREVEEAFMRHRLAAEERGARMALEAALLASSYCIKGGATRCGTATSIFRM